MPSLREWLNTEVDPIIKPLVAQALIEQPANFEKWLLEQLTNGGGGGSNGGGSKKSKAARRNSYGGNYGDDESDDEDRQGKVKLSPDGEEYIDSESSEDEDGEEAQPYTGPQVIKTQKINLNVLDNHGILMSPVQANVVVKPLQAVNEFMGMYLVIQMILT